MFFAFSHFNNFFVTHGHKPAIFIFVRPDFIRTITKPKPPAFQNISSKFGKQTRNLFYIMAKFRKPISLYSKRPKCCHFLTKGCLTEKKVR